MDPTTEGATKFSVDVATSRHGDVTIVAIVCRNMNGGYLGSLSITFGGIIDVPLLEALDIGKAQALVDDLLVNQILIVEI